MSDLRKAAQQVLETWDTEDWFDSDALRAALRAALAQPELRNQCAEACERAKVCAFCQSEIRGIEPDLEGTAHIEAGEPRPATVVRQPRPEPEPVAWRYALDASVEGPRWIYIEQDPNKWRQEPGMVNALIEPLYTAPPQRKPLTDQEAKVLWADVYEPEPHIWVIAERFARAIEAAHGIGGEA